ncbi:MAG: hypothetical protein Q8Q09_01935 [Deltaproteobacteria bacterium]|nr:hypothetical protein [Deltaproteobacteria bacterium]
MKNPMFKPASLMVLASLAACVDPLDPSDIARRNRGDVGADALGDSNPRTDAFTPDAEPVTPDVTPDVTPVTPDAAPMGQDAAIDLGIDMAVVVSHTLPSSLACAATTPATVTLRNTGNTTWSNATNYALQAVNSEDLFLTGSENVALGFNVPPGGEYTFRFTLSAPGAGNFPTQWRMVRGGVRRFGDVAERMIRVVCTDPFRAYPVVIDGTFSMPAHEQRIASRNTSLLSLGHRITGNDEIDNNVLGGGSPDGGIWLSGSFHFEVNAAGQNTPASWLRVFAYGPFPVTGGIYPNGELHMGSEGIDISGLLKNGVVTGYVAEAGRTVGFESALWNRLPMADQTNLRGIWHGAELTYVHGRMSGMGVLR